MGKKGKRDRQARMWVATADLPKSAWHPFYAQLNRVLDDAGFDTFVEAQCAQFYADGIGRPSLAPGRYWCFRHQLLLPHPYLVLTKPLRLDIQCQRAASVKIGWKYLDD